MQQYPYTLWTDLFQDYPIIQSDNEAIAHKLGREVKIIADDWESEIDCGAIHPERNWFAWKEYRQRLTKDERNWIVCNYYLHIVADGSETLNWPIKTYNPVFGCGADYFRWYKDSFVMIYHEKHHYYGVSCSLSNVERLVELCQYGGEGAVKDDVFYVYFPYGNALEPLRRFSLPNFVELNVMTLEAALAEGVLVKRAAS